MSRGTAYVAAAVSAAPVAMVARPVDRSLGQNRSASRALQDYGRAKFLAPNEVNHA
jgi:hypothetical protein